MKAEHKMSHVIVLLSIMISWLVNIQSVFFFAVSVCIVLVPVVISNQLDIQSVSDVEDDRRIS